MKMGVKNFHLFLFLYLFSALQIPALGDKKSYVVYLGKHSHASAEPSALDLERVTDYHHEILGSCMGSKDQAKEAIFSSYTRYINGFAAMIEDEVAAELSKHPEVVSVFPSQVRKLHTTRSWEFLGLERNGETPAGSLWQKAKFGQDIIIGVIDSGVWPESESCNDAGMGPVPSKWKGRCETYDGVKCNRKLVGARYFNKGFAAEYAKMYGRPLDASYNSARDHTGHGSHTLSTAGGSFVPGASLLGSSNGTAKGGAPLARVASYRVCFPACTDPDILDAIDAAIHDGVDVISISLGPSFDEGQEFVLSDYFMDTTAIGAFHAVENGIVVVASAGNEGPKTVQNVAPWILTVAASSINRDFPSDVILGSNKQVKGWSFNTNTSPPGKYYPLINSVDAKAANASYSDAKVCEAGSLDPAKVKGKIVYCTRDSPVELQKSFVVARAGGVGMILANQLQSWTISPEAHFVPTAHVSAGDGLTILSYIYSTKSPVAYIRGTTELGPVAAPIMASFSSSGPNSLTPEILKPDITAPGVNILAAYTEATGPDSEFPKDPRRLPFNIISGTSMSCPHVSGISALLRKVHPDWSPAAIKSAIMTTARTKSNMREPIPNAYFLKADSFDYGSGHVWPNRAMDPGLVYDLTTTDYYNFLCFIGYNSTQLSSVAKKQYKCPTTGGHGLLDFNYPSITVPNLSSQVTLTRTLKNVGTPGSYKVSIKAPEGISVKVKPTILKFSKIYEEKTFKLTLKAERKTLLNGLYAFGGLTWSDGKHNVRSPIVVKTVKHA